MAESNLLIYDPQRTFLPRLEAAFLSTSGHKWAIPTSLMEVETSLASVETLAAFVAMSASAESTIQIITRLRAKKPGLPVFLLSESEGVDVFRVAMHTHTEGIFTAPFQAADIRAHLERLPGGAGISPAKLQELETLAQLGKSVTRKLDLDDVLTSIVEAAVRLTGAEEGSLMLVDERTGELYMRASKNFDQQFVRTFRVKVQDSLAGEVIRTGEPILLDANSPKKIKTSFLVHSLVFVPLLIGNKSIGLLGVDNRAAGRPLSDHDLSLMQALAEYAVIALENAQLYDRSQANLRQLETILQQVEDAVLITDSEGIVLLANQAAREALTLDNNRLVGHPIREVAQNPELQLIFTRRNTANQQLRRAEIALPDGRILNAHLTSIEGVGYAIVMQDITRLKELDRIKSEFVSAVSHDLRSPLTTILGYVDLIERAGSVNPQQKEFITRIQSSVQSITALITDLLDLGKIESGIDAQKEPVQLNILAQSALDGLRARAEAKRLALQVSLSKDIPVLNGNPIRLRQMAANLLDNAVKYSPEGGKVSLTTRKDNDQVILEVSDSGIGIPTLELPYIFNKFFRASNAQNTIGTGLGLSIVKSIVETHGGRIWVDSQSGKGTTFTVVLPIPKIPPDLSSQQSAAPR